MTPTPINILDFCSAIGEEAAEGFLSDFSCRKNDEVQTFLHKNSISFAQKKLSITYLVVNKDDGFILGYYTLTHKPLRIDADLLDSATQKKKMERYARLDEENNTYNVSSFLIAQFARNDISRKKYGFTGDDLMRLTLNTLKEIQWLIGGGIVFLECEPKEELLTFYTNENNRFREFGERKDQKEGKTYKQLLRFL